MGVVYRARQVKLNRVVALKMILHADHAGPEHRQRFRTEAEAVARLQHPNVVQIHEVGEHNGLPFFSLEFCEGGSLEKKLGGTPLPPPEAAGLVQTLALAMHAAHERGIVHRDLKPANVLLAADGTPKVTDFGLAKRLDDAAGLTASGAIMGTPSYMAPEQAGGKTHAIGPAADVYALGAILYGLLTGRPPFKAATPLDTLAQVLTEEPVPPRRLQPRTPHDLETVCLKALAKEPGRRYPSARELAEDLGRFLRGEPTRARPVGRLGRAWRWCLRNPAPAALAGVSAVAVLVLAGVIGTSAALVYRKNRELEQTNQDLDGQRNQARLAEQKANEAREQAEVTLARSLLRPLGGPGGPGDAELKALWELAESPSDRLRLLFVENALRRPETAWQLRERRELALHAAVGLDRGRRQRMEELLLVRLRDPLSDRRLREIVVLVGVALGDTSAAFATEGARALVEAMGKVSDPSALASSAEALAGRLEREDAARHTSAAARAVVQAMSEATDPSARADLAVALAVLGGRLESGEAATAARAVAQAMGRTSDPIALAYLADALRALVGRLEPGEAATAASAAARAMEQTADPEALRALAGGLLALAGRLEPGEAAHHASAAARAVAQAVDKTTTPSALLSLAEALAALAGRLEPGEAARHASAAARAVAQAMDNTAEPVALFSLGRALAALGGRLESEEAATAARTVARAMSKTTSLPTLSSLAEAVAALAGRLEPGEAARHASAAARAVAQAMGKTTIPSAVASLAEVLAALAGRLEPAEAARHTSAATRAVVEAMGKTAEPDSLRSLAMALAALANRLEPGEASAAARAVVRAMDKNSNPKELQSLARVLAALAGRLEPEERARDASAAARAVVQAMGKATEPSARAALAVALAVLGHRLGPGEASAVARAVVEEMGKTTHFSELCELASALAALAGGLEPGEAARHTSAAARMVLEATSMATLPVAVSSLAEALAALAVRMESGEAWERAVVAARAVGEGLSPPTRLSGLATLLRASQPPASRFSTQELVDLLKMPTCVGPARAVILRQLGQKCDRHFAGVWEFVDWAHEYRPDLDLTTPPKRPRD
jgi:hypothetical protein